MKTLVMYFPAHIAGIKNTKFYKEINAEWEAFVDTSGSESLSFGYVTSKKFVTRPTNRQLRALKSDHRKAVAEAIMLKSFI